MWVAQMPSTKKFKVRLSKRGVINIPQSILDSSGISIGSPVWIFSDGEIMVIMTPIPFIMEKLKMGNHMVWV